MIRITIKDDKGGKACNKMIALIDAQHMIAEVLVREINSTTIYHTLLLLHAVELRDMFSQKLHRPRNPQKKYTITLTATQAEAYRLIWGKLKLNYGAYGAIYIQSMLDEINREIDKPFAHLP